MRIGEHIERIDEKLNNILEKTIKNEEHLRQINGTLLRHEKKLSEHDIKINKLYYYLGMGIGGISIIFLLIDLIKL